jgi:hypothetical protein
VHDQPQPTEEEQEQQAPDPRKVQEEAMRGAGTDQRDDEDE